MAVMLESMTLPKNLATKTTSYHCLVKKTVSTRNIYGMLIVLGKKINQMHNKKNCKHKCN